MSAYNWIVFEDRCPRCMGRSPIKAQCHVASSYGGDDSGRFFDRTYRLGQTMAWWPQTDKRWSRWRGEHEHAVERHEGTVRECCYAECETCGVELCAVIEFRDLIVVNVIEVGLEPLWPPDFPR